MEFADFLVLFHQCGESGAEHLFRMIFVEFRERLRLWEIQTGFLVGGAYEFCSVSLAGAGADADTVECDFALCPVFAEEASIAFHRAGTICRSSAGGRMLARGVRDREYPWSSWLLIQTWVTGDIVTAKCARVQTRIVRIVSVEFARAN